MSLSDEVLAILADLRSQLGARRVSVVPNAGHEPPHGLGGLRAVPLGNGARLEIEHGALAHTDEEVDAAIEIAVRALRAAARAAAGELPAMTVVADQANRPLRVAERIHAYLEALANLHGAANALVVLRGEVIASARDVEPLHASRAELLVRRAQAAARAAGVSHGELADPDAFVVTFWYGAALIVYFGDDYATDFVRHRARMVARELAQLLPELDPDPAAPAIALQPD